MMGSPGPRSARQRPGSDDITSLRLSPTPAEDYRCPVSTPSNYVQRHARVRRMKPLDNIYSQPNSGGRSHRSRGAVFSLSRTNRCQGTNSRWAPKTSRAFDYYFVDKKSDKRDDAQTNTVWLKALCSQPVNEILNKYRRKSEVKRTRTIWTKTFSTPGEKSLLDAWENNNFRSRNKIKSAIVGGARRTISSSRKGLRPTQSEPPFSTSPDEDDLSVSSPGHVKEFLAEPVRESPRVSTYTTQVFRRVGKSGKETMYTKMIAGPEHLPNIGGRYRVHSLLNNSQYYYAPKSLQNSPLALSQHTGTTGPPSSPRRSPLLEEEDVKETEENRESPLMETVSR